MAGEKENEKMYDVSALGFGDNVVDKYEHIKTMYPGGNCVNFAVYAKMFGAKRSAYMGYFGNDAEAEHVMYALDDIGIETVKCKQLEGENGCARIPVHHQHCSRCIPCHQFQSQKHNPHPMHGDQMQ